MTVSFAWLSVQDPRCPYIFIGNVNHASFRKTFSLVFLSKQKSQITWTRSIGDVMAEVVPNHLEENRWRGEKEENQEKKKKGRQYVQKVYWGNQDPGFLFNLKPCRLSYSLWHWHLLWELVWVLLFLFWLNSYWCSWERIIGWPVSLGTCKHAWEPDTVLSSWLRPGPTTTVVTIWAVNHWIE